jgi:hypothetical protein
MISMPMVRSTQIVHLSCIKISALQIYRSELPLEPRHVGVPSSVSKMISEPMVRLAQTMLVSCADTILSPNGPNRDSTWHMSPSSSIGCVQNDFEAYGTFNANCASIVMRTSTPIIHPCRPCRHLLVLLLMLVLEKLIIKWVPSWALVHPV